MSSFAAKRDAGQGIVDLVSDPGGQETDAGQAFGPDQLPAAFVDLLGQIAIHFAQPRRHGIEGVGQVLDLVAGMDLDLVFEIPLGSSPHAQLRGRG